ncbi:MAG: YqaE/Pmp3 family membrane protein [Rickettsiales bacterium]|nr:YqaE/Pmp3 family membrane protein [Rickettsiales bacterium]|tara:strand:- start:100 stop:291 length:192 start_codon:yes stop_codon:yes gene_type:complete
MALQKTQDSLIGDLFKILLAVILPPLGVFFEVGLTKHFWLNILFTLFGFLPGIIHAVYIISTR